MPKLDKFSMPSKEYLEEMKQVFGPAREGPGSEYVVHGPPCSSFDEGDRGRCVHCNWTGTWHEKNPLCPHCSVQMRYVEWKGLDLCGMYCMNPTCSNAYPDNE